MTFSKYFRDREGQVRYINLSLAFLPGLPCQFWSLTHDREGLLYHVNVYLDRQREKGSETKKTRYKWAVNFLRCKCLELHSSTWTTLQEKTKTPSLPPSLSSSSSPWEASWSLEVFALTFAPANTIGVQKTTTTRQDSKNVPVDSGVSFEHYNMQLWLPVTTEKRWGVDRARLSHRSTLSGYASVRCS